MPPRTTSKVRALDHTAVERIIQVVGLQAHDINGLCVDLIAANEAFAVRSSNIRARKSHAEAITHHASELRRLLGEAGDRALDLHLWWECDTTDRQTLMAALDEISIAAMSMDVGGDAPLKTLIADILAEVYEKHFHRKAGRSTSADGSKIEGPYVRFVKAVANEFGFSVSEHTVNIYLRA